MATGPLENNVGWVNATVTDVRYDALRQTVALELGLQADRHISAAQCRIALRGTRWDWDGDGLRFVETTVAEHRINVPVHELRTSEHRVVVQFAFPANVRLGRIGYDMTVAAEHDLEVRTEPQDVIVYGHAKTAVIIPGERHSLKRSDFRGINDAYEEQVANTVKASAAHTGSHRPIVFIGDSFMRRWATLHEDFPQWNVVNAGLGGAHIVDSLYYADRLIGSFEPNVIVMCSGLNDTYAGKSPVQILVDYVAFVHWVRATLPGTRIVGFSIPPSPRYWDMQERIANANRLIQLYASTDELLDYVDIVPLMFGATNVPQPHLYIEDEIHLNTKGYALWKDAVMPYLVDE